MIRSGTTCFADMYYFEESVAEAAAAAGLRALCAQTVLKFPSPDAASFEDSLARARDFIARWKGHPLIVPAPAPHAPYTCTAEILRACAELAVEFDVPLHTHLAETAFEVEQSRREHGMPVVPWVTKQRLFDARVLAAHCVHVDEGEMRALEERRRRRRPQPDEQPEARLGHRAGRENARARRRRRHRHRRHGVEQRPRHVRGDAPGGAARQGRRAAIRPRCRRVRRWRWPRASAPAPSIFGDITGSLEPGKRADLIVVDLDQVHNTPRFDRDPNAVYSQLVYAGKSTDVVDVMCDGRWLMRDRRLLTLDEEALARRRARRGAPHRHVPDPSASRACCRS